MRAVRNTIRLQAALDPAVAEENPDNDADCYIYLTKRRLVAPAQSFRPHKIARCRKPSACSASPSLPLRQTQAEQGFLSMPAEIVFCFALALNSPRDVLALSLTCAGVCAAVANIAQWKRLPTAMRALGHADVVEFLDTHDVPWWARVDMIDRPWKRGSPHGSWGRRVLGNFTLRGRFDAQGRLDGPGVIDDRDASIERWTIWHGGRVRSHSLTIEILGAHGRLVTKCALEGYFYADEPVTENEGSAIDGNIVEPLFRMHKKKLHEVNTPYMSALLDDIERITQVSYDDGECIVRPVDESSALYMPLSRPWPGGRAYLYDATAEWTRANSSLRSYRGSWIIDLHSERRQPPCTGPDRWGRMTYRDGSVREGFFRTGELSGYRVEYKLGDSVIIGVPGQSAEELHRVRIDLTNGGIAWTPTEAAFVHALGAWLRSPEARHRSSSLSKTMGMVTWRGEPTPQRYEVFVDLVNDLARRRDDIESIVLST